MTYGTFEALIQLHIAHHNRIQALYKLRVDLIDTFTEQDKIVDLLWQEVLTEFGYDWLMWYLYEKNGVSGEPRADLQAWDDEKNEICKDVKGLYDYLVKENYFIKVLLDNR